MRIGGFQKLTLVDFPGKVAATVFTQGCNFRCSYCHNPELVCPEKFGSLIPVEEVLAELKIRQGKLQGVVITGGEPTIQKGLADFIREIRELGFAVKLDTNGSHPEVLEALIEAKLVDYVAMDIKTSLARYSQFCDPFKIQESIEIILQSGLPHQFRTTVVKTLCSPEDFFDIHQTIVGTNHYVLQAFVVAGKMVDPSLDQQDQYTCEEFTSLKDRFEIFSV